MHQVHDPPSVGKTLMARSLANPVVHLASDQQRARARGIDPSGGPTCRACRSRVGSLVLDLGQQPAAEHFPPEAEPGPDEAHPLQMWLCGTCCLAQLLGVSPECGDSPGLQPAAFAAQAADALERVSAAGYLPRGARFAEYRSPHGSSWANIVASYDLTEAPEYEPADVVLDSFGLMHVADQAIALTERAARVAPGGVLLLQYHALDAIVAQGQWNVLRHGHYAYHSTTALVKLLAFIGFAVRTSWRFDLLGGTAMLAAARSGEVTVPDSSVASLLRRDEALGVTDAAVLHSLQRRAEAHAAQLHGWLTNEQRCGRGVVGYGAASRAVPLLIQAGVNRELLHGVIDASAIKQGRRMPGTDIPILPLHTIAEHRFESVLLFVPDLLPEVRAAFPEVEARNARWVDAMAPCG